MFGFGKSKIEKVFDQLNMTTHFSNTPAERIFQRSDIEKIYYLSSDVNTTVQLTLLMHQAIFAQRMHEQAPKVDIAKGYIDAAKEKNQDAETLMEVDLDGQVEAAKLYCETITEQLENGRIRSNIDVRHFCDKYCTLMLTSWVLYRSEVNASFINL